MRGSSPASRGTLPSGGSHSSKCPETLEIKNIVASDLRQEPPVGGAHSGLLTRRTHYGGQSSAFRKSQKANNGGWNYVLLRLRRVVGRVRRFGSPVSCRSAIRLRATRV